MSNNVMAIRRLQAAFEAFGAALLAASTTASADQAPVLIGAHAWWVTAYDHICTDDGHADTMFDVVNVGLAHWRRQTGL